jgi:hypothetical protein
LDSDRKCGLGALYISALTWDSLDSEETRKLQLPASLMKLGLNAASHVADCLRFRNLADLIAPSPTTIAIDNHLSSSTAALLQLFKLDVHLTDRKPKSSLR